MTGRFNLSSAYEGPLRQAATHRDTGTDSAPHDLPSTASDDRSLSSTGSRAVAGDPVAEAQVVAEPTCGGEGKIEVAIGECEIAVYRCEGCADCEGTVDG
jgi:hypothetical protein